MRTTPCGRALSLVAAAGLLLSLTSRSTADDGDPPERVAVADLIEGSAAAQFAGVGDWTADLANRPLTSGDKVWVDANSRAQLHLGSTAIRLGANTGLQFLNVADSVAQLRLSAGSMNVRLRYLSPDERVEVDTPNSAISLLQAGEYRIDVSDTGDAVTVAVWRGQAEVAGQTQSFALEQQQLGEFQGTDTLGVQFSDLPAADNLDQWSQYLDQREDASLTANFLSRDESGYTDMDGSGNWQSDPDYGEVWYPPVIAGWAPYSQGCWVWIAPWGWTWIDDAPWGFVPFHYGRWVHVRSGWAWSPGQWTVRPVYAPALVAWGTGPNSTVGWVPLGYNEIYRPSMRVSNAYLRRVNVSNTYIDNTVSLDYKTVATAPHYANQSIPGALVAVTPETFTAARAVSREQRPVAANQMVMSAGNSLSPTPKSRVRAAALGRTAAPIPPQRIFSRATVARSAPPVRERRVILTNVPRAQPTPQFLSAPSAPVQQMPAYRDAQPGQVAKPPRETHPAGESRPARTDQPADRTDRPASMPRAAPERAAPAADRPAPAPQRTAPVVERSVPPAENSEKSHTDRPAESPVRKATPPPAAPHTAPERNPPNSLH
jgi:uncharacterized protein DUF6600/FecR-like protein